MTVTRFHSHPRLRHTGDIKARDRYRAIGLEPDPEDYPEIY